MANYDPIQFEPPPGLLVRGLYLLGCFTHIHAQLTDTIFNAHGVYFSEIEPEKFYSVDCTLSAFREIWQQPGGDLTMVAIGKAIGTIEAQYTSSPSVEAYLRMLPYERTHYTFRNIPEGFGLEPIFMGRRFYKVRNNTPMPNFLVYGMLHEIMRRLEPDTLVEVTQVTALTPDSLEGATYDLRW